MYDGFMNMLKTRKPQIIKKIEYFLFPICLLALAALHALDAIGPYDLAITLAAVLLFGAAAIGLRRAGGERYAFIPALLLAAVVLYVASALMATGSFTWHSDTAALLQVMGLLCTTCLFLFLYALTGRLLPTIVSGSAVSLLFGGANCMMMQFRGRLFLVGDLSALRTAVNVAGTYSLDISAAFVLAALLSLVGCLLAISLGGKPDLGKKERLVTRGAALACAGIYTMAVFYGGIFETNGIRLTWNENDFEESPVLYFVESIRSMNVDQPEGYSKEALAAISAESALPVGGKKPHVIAIMNEAFSDLRRIGDFETNVEITPFIDGLTENTVRGAVYSSVFGGSTANSEFELLTGMTMAFIPKGAAPYQSYIKYEKDSLVSVLEAQGYTSAALHPYDASGWNREAVYDCFGFDEVRFIDEFQNKRYLRGYVTDESNFENLIGRYEARNEGERLFLFNITMQNHGSYKSESYESTVSISGHEGEFPQAEQYLSLLRETDKAVNELITYFSRQDEPVVILFFGDHQPALETEFYDMLYGKTADELSLEEMQRKYLTPFFIWANYDIDEADAGLTSINYLSPMLLRAAGLEGSDFEAFLLDLQAQWPVLNAYGCVNASGEHLPLESDEAAESGSLGNYRILQYNYLFDTTGYRKDFFSLDAAGAPASE